MYSNEDGDDGRVRRVRRHPRLAPMRSREIPDRLALG